MALSFTAGANDAQAAITTGLPNINGTHTVMGWLFTPATFTAYGLAWQMGQDVTAGTHTLEYDSIWIEITTGRLVSFVQAVGAFTQGGTTALSASTWYHVAATRSAGTAYNVYLNGILDHTNAQNIAGRGASTGFRLGTEADASSVLKGRLAYLKAWDGVALSADEILAEKDLIRPVRYANLYGFWPTFPGATEHDRDYSGNGHDWVESGSGAIQDADPPPVSYGAPSLGVGSVAVAAATKALPPFARPHRFWTRRVA